MQHPKLFLQSLGILSSLSLLGSGLVWAEPETSEPLAAEMEDTAEIEEIPVFEDAPEVRFETPAEPEPEVEFAPDPSPEERIILELPEEDASLDASWTEVEEELLEPVTFESSEESYTEENYVEESYVEEGYTEESYVEESYTEENDIESAESYEENDAGDTSAYIDTEDYNLGATETYEEPQVVIFSERSSGCEAAIAAGESPGDLCDSVGIPGPPQPLPTELEDGTVVRVPAVRPPVGNTYAPDAIQPPVVRIQAGDRLPSPDRPAVANEVLPPVGEAAQNQDIVIYTDETYADETYTDETYTYEVGPSVSPEAARVNPADYYDADYYQALALQKRASRSASRPGLRLPIIFPLAIPAPITSAYGWRIHPISGTRRFHEGTDIGAPLGTPVVAALAGRVLHADWLGGYGITAILQHKDGKAETLYGHMSKLAVRAGDWVEQGDVIGLVGSTGFSTGPHLHFEARQHTEAGTITVDPGAQLEVALANFIDILENPKPDRPRLARNLTVPGAFEALPKPPETTARTKVEKTTTPQNFLPHVFHVPTDVPGNLPGNPR